MVTEGARTARILRWHAATGVAAVAASLALIADGRSVQYPIPGAHESWYGVTLFHLGVVAPLWILLAVQLVQLRLRVAATGAGVAAAAAITSEILTRWIEARGVAAWSESAAWATLVGLLGAVVWLVATLRGLARGAARLAESTLLLPTVRAREAALRLRAALRVGVPWLAALAGFLAIAGAAIPFVAVATASFLVYTGAQLGLAHLIAKSRGVATATVRR